MALRLAWLPASAVAFPGSAPLSAWCLSAAVDGPHGSEPLVEVVLDRQEAAGAELDLGLQSRTSRET
jgi:hypothetical protein